MCCFHSHRPPVCVAWPCSHPEPQNQGGWAGRDRRSCAGEADAGKGSTWDAQSGFKTITRSCPSPGGAEGWGRQVKPCHRPLAYASLSPTDHESRIQWGELRTAPEPPRFQRV